MKKIGFLLIFALCLVLSGCKKKTSQSMSRLILDIIRGHLKLECLTKMERIY